MGDNTTLNPGAGGDSMRDIDKGLGIKTQVVALDLGGAGPESLLTGTLPVSAAALPLPTGAATSANQATEIASLANIDVALSTRTKPADQQHAIIDSSVLPSGAATDAILTGGTQRSQIYDPQFAASVMVDSLRGIRSHQMVRLFGDNFSDGLGIGKDAGTFPPYVTCTDTATWNVSGGVLQMRTGSANNGASAILQSLRRADRISATVSGFQSTIKAPAPTTWKIVSRKDGSDTPILSGAFNGTTNTPDNNFHRNELFYQGPGSAKFDVDSVLLHSLSGQPSSPRTSTLDLPIRYELVNDAVNTVVRWGMFDTANGYFYEAVYLAADITLSVHGSSCLVFGPGIDGYGYPAPLALNASQEDGGNLARILDYLVGEQQELLTNILMELRISNHYLYGGMASSVMKEEPDHLRKDPTFYQ